MTDIEIHTENIQLDQFLKLAGAVPSGGVVKELIAEGAILRNGEVETARRRQLVQGDIITVDGTDIYRITRA
ncbi:RNA-binding S4 domain-containing protein [Selenomonas sp. oral taxon 138]|uniref:RNA-binding S4 domain-containing protein n=1 Tax=Selenomonas sp. oral taxon 138 TaxID=712532 RepID=UPI0002A3201C|nr:RNA-binding S4 domain-containing protein [Selenomonas sp. oral taxon 138]EKX97715.1 S4 domain protein [Selenomonas sp. oral taxon 138 str. F0429]